MPEQNIEPSENDMAASIADLPTDVRDLNLELSKDEKVRSVALMMGIRYYTDTIIKDARYLELMMQREKEAKFSNDPDEKALWHLRPANVMGVLQCALAFEAFLLGKPTNIIGVKVGDEEIEAGARRGVQTETDSA